VIVPRDDRRGRREQVLQLSRSRRRVRTTAARRPAAAALVGDLARNLVLREDLETLRTAQRLVIDALRESLLARHAANPTETERVWVELRAVARPTSLRESSPSRALSPEARSLDVGRERVVVSRRVAASGRIGSGDLGGVGLRLRGAARRAPGVVASRMRARQSR